MFSSENSWQIIARSAIQSQRQATVPVSGRAHDLSAVMFSGSGLILALWGSAVASSDGVAAEDVIASVYPLPGCSREMRHNANIENVRGRRLPASSHGEIVHAASTDLREYLGQQFRVLRSIAACKSAGSRTVCPLLGA